jgi:hypothetical protein
VEIRGNTAQFGFCLSTVDRHAVQLWKAKLPVRKKDRKGNHEEISVAVLVFTLLTACSSSTSTPMNSTNCDIPIGTQLAVGTLKLAGTDQIFP